jgi:hypothetical protein
LLQPLQFRLKALHMWTNTAWPAGCVAKRRGGV